MIDTGARTARIRVRVRFAGTADSDTFQMTEAECARFQEDWRSYLGGDGRKGGEYTCQSGENPAMISFNFEQIAYCEPGKVY